jgi:DNA helicase II / ATP-dependent DNA helicase PcrA
MGAFIASRQMESSGPGASSCLTAYHWFALADAVSWATDLLRDGASCTSIRARIKIGNQSTLLTAPGVHLLNAHLGKGQQFDWVILLGAEDGCIPDFRAKTPAAREEEARVLSVMISRARYGVVVCRAQAVEDRNGRSWSKNPSPFLEAFDGSVACPTKGQVEQWLRQAAWNVIGCAAS